MFVTLLADGNGASQYWVTLLVRRSRRLAIRHLLRVRLQVSTSTHIDSENGIFYIQIKRVSGA